MIIPAQADDALLADIGRPDPPGPGFRLWWLGQSGFLISYRGRRLLLDPYLSDALTAKYAGTDRPHVRMTARAVDPGRLTGISVVTSSHNHTDHLDALTLRPLMAASPGVQLVIPEANRAFVAQRLGCAPDLALGCDDGETVSVGDFALTGVAAAHEEVERDSAGRCRFLGYVVRFGAWTVYHSGDTLRHAGLLPALAAQRIDLALLPINGRRPERHVAGNLDGPEAAALAHEAGVRLVIPCHYDMFTFNTANPQDFVAAARRLGQSCQVLRCGQAWHSDELPPG